MKTFCCIIYGKYRKVENPKISYIFKKRLVFSIICCKCKNDDEKIFKKEESIEILKTLGLFKIHNYFKTRFEKNINQEFRLKNVDKTINYFLEEIEQNE